MSSTNQPETESVVCLNCGGVVLGDCACEVKAIQCPCCPRKIFYSDLPDGAALGGHEVPECDGFQNLVANEGVALVTTPSERLQ
jgi:hypothetical protein